MHKTQKLQGQTLKLFAVRTGLPSLHDVAQDKLLAPSGLINFVYLNA